MEFIVKQNQNKINDTLLKNLLIEFTPIYFLSIWRDIPINQITKRVPQETIENITKKFKYLVNITQFPYQCVLTSSYYLYMLTKRHQELKGYGSEINLLVMALMTTNKIFYDNTYSNKTWSEISDIPLSELNIMEFEFCDVLDYNLNIDVKNYKIWENYMINLSLKFKNYLNETEYSSSQTNTLKVSSINPNVQKQRINNPPSPISPITPI